MLTARKKEIKLCLAVGFSYTDLHFYSTDWKGGKTHSLNVSLNFLYLRVFVLNVYCHPHLSKHVYKLNCSIIQINKQLAMRSFASVHFSSNLSIKYH